jgi:hypothetical protein
LAKGRFGYLLSSKSQQSPINYYLQLAQDQPERLGRIAFWDQSTAKDKWPPPRTWLGEKRLWGWSTVGRRCRELSSYRLWASCRGLLGQALAITRARRPRIE